jgi:hypothetical protein
MRGASAFCFLTPDGKVWCGNNSVQEEIFSVPAEQRISPPGRHGPQFGTGTEHFAVSLNQTKAAE